jgi:hypothetical protein
VNIYGQHCHSYYSEPARYSEWELRLRSSLSWSTRSSFSWDTRQDRWVVGYRRFVKFLQFVFFRSISNTWHSSTIHRTFLSSRFSVPVTLNYSFRDFSLSVSLALGTFPTILKIPITLVLIETEKQTTSPTWPYRILPSTALTQTCTPTSAVLFVCKSIGIRTKCNLSYGLVTSLWIGNNYLCLKQKLFRESGCHVLWDWRQLWWRVAGTSQRTFKR